MAPIRYDKTWKQLLKTGDDYSSILQLKCDGFLIVTHWLDLRTEKNTSGAGAPTTTKASKHCNTFLDIMSAAPYEKRIKLT